MMFLKYPVVSEKIYRGFNTQPPLNYNDLLYAFLNNLQDNQSFEV